jgi:hypothetical protein
MQIPYLPRFLSPSLPYLDNLELNQATSLPKKKDTEIRPFMICILVVGCGQNGLAEDKIFVANRKEWVIT